MYFVLNKQAMLRRRERAAALRRVIPTHKASILPVVDMVVAVVGLV